MAGIQEAPIFCEDSSLGYLRSRTVIPAGAGLSLDASYRLAHLPLVNPAHRDVIRSMPEKAYLDGVHQRVHSLVMPLEDSALSQSEAFASLDAAVREASFGKKVAWDIVAKRRHKLHATLCGGLGEGERVPSLTEETLSALADVGPVRARVSGLFSGNVNTGRLYLMVYPEKREGANMFQQVQRIMGRPTTDLYLVGLYNLIDHLSVDEAAELDRMISQWWGCELLELELRELWLMSSTDDLVLDGRIEAKILLCNAKNA